jgi:hypothetical protein
MQTKPTRLRPSMRKLKACDSTPLLDTEAHETVDMGRQRQVKTII